MAIPVVDPLIFYQEIPKRNSDFVQSTREMLMKTSFCSQSKSWHNQIFNCRSSINSCSNFFSAAGTKKEKYEKAELAGQRGYTLFGKEHAKAADAPDLKEFFQFGQTVND